MKEFDLGRLRERHPNPFLYLPDLPQERSSYPDLINCLREDGSIPEALVRGIRRLASHEEYPGLLVKTQMEALKKLLLSPEITPVYDHLYRFKLDENEWVQVVAYVFAGPLIYMSGIAKGSMKEDEKKTRKETKELYSRIALQAHDLMESIALLPAEGSLSLEPLNEYLKTSNIELLLAELRMLTTSWAWPKLEWQIMSGHDYNSTIFEWQTLNGYEDVFLMNLEEVIEEESPGLFDRKKPGKKALFPPPDIELPEGYYKSQKNVLHSDYLREALLRLDRVSHDFGRSFAKAAGKEATKQAAVWLKADHWQAITELLLYTVGGRVNNPASGQPSFSDKHINRIIEEHKTKSEYWEK